MVWPASSSQAESSRTRCGDGERVARAHLTEASPEDHRKSGLAGCCAGKTMLAGMADDNGSAVVARKSGSVVRNWIPRTACRRGNQIEPIKGRIPTLIGAVETWRVTLNAQLSNTCIQPYNTVRLHCPRAEHQLQALVASDVLRMSETASQARERRSKSYRGCTPCKYAARMP